MKFVIGLGSIGGLTLLLAVLWFSRDPTTVLQDSVGAPLVASVVENEADLESLFSNARLMLEAGRFAEAKTELLGILEREQHDGVACLLLSQAARELNQVNEAVDYGLKAVQLLPEHAPAHLAYARALGTQLMTGVQGVGGILAAIPRINRFKAELDLVVKYDPMDTEARTMQVFTAMAPGIGDADRALEIAQEIVEIDELIGKKMLAYAYSNKGQVERAIEVCRESIQTYPDENGFALILAGLYRDEERFDEARQAFAQVRAIGPANEDFYLSLIKQAAMQIEQNLGLEEALGLLQEFVAARPSGDWIPAPAEAQYLLGAVHLGLDRKREARSFFEESLRLQSDHKASKKALKDLD